MSAVTQACLTPYISLPLKSPSFTLNWDKKSISMWAGIQDDFIQSFYLPFLSCIMLAGPLWGRLVSIHNPIHGGAGVIMMTPFLACRHGTDHDCKCLLTYCPRRCSAHYYANSFLWLARLCYPLQLPALLSRRPSLISHSGHRSAWL